MGIINLVVLPVTEVLADHQDGCPGTDDHHDQPQSSVDVTRPNDTDIERQYNETYKTKKNGKERQYSERYETIL